MAKDASPDNIWDDVANLIKAKVTDEAKFTKKQYQQLDRGSLSVNLFPIETKEHNKFLRHSKCYHIQANTLTDLAPLGD